MKNRKKIEFADHVLEELKECVRAGTFDLDAESTADYAVQLGLWKRVPYDSHRHDIDNYGFEDGDMIYIWDE